MKSFTEAVREVNFSLGKIALFEVLLNGFVVFLFFYLIFLLLGLTQYITMAITALYIVVFSLRRSRRSSIRAVETAYPELNEKLRTAVEAQYVDNPVVNELQAEVLRDLKQVEEAAFFNSRDTYAKLGLIIGLSFLVFFFSPISLGAVFDIDISGLLSPVNLPFDTDNDESNRNVFTGSEAAGVQLGEEDIYGEPFLAQTGNEDLFVTISPGGYELSVQKIYDARPLEFDEAYPDEVFASSGEVFEEDIPVEQQELVKNYFKQLAEG